MRRTFSVLAVACLVAGCAPKTTVTTTNNELPTVTITTAKIEAKEVQRSVNVVGSLTGFDEVILSPKVDGRVRKIWIDVGDRVYPGQTVLELDPVDLQLEVDSARRAFEAELARLGLEQLPEKEFRPQDVPSVGRAIIVRNNTKNEHDRVKKLLDSGSVSTREMDTATLELKTAEVNLKDAETQALATLAAARLRKSNLEASEQRLLDARLMAPIPELTYAWGAAVGAPMNPVSYVVSARLITEGEFVRSNPVTNAFRLVIDMAVKLRTTVPEQFSGEVKIGQAVNVKLEAYPNLVFNGLVSRINPTVDRETRTFAVEIGIPNFDGKLKPGSFARAEILTKTESVKVLTPEALQTFAGVNKVFVIDANKAAVREVKLGARGKNWIELLTDLPIGATVATSGFSQLVEGSPISLRK
ncbi:MAG: efflux RND transporter periplasmic adaptor subunit [Fimbriiglobus sp.]